jgi:heterodisulfide reductase subunit D
VKDAEFVSTYRIEDCTRCKNECASACPVFRHYGSYHPQQLAHLFLAGGESAAHDHRLIWTCVTCKACTEACPFKVEFADFIRELRVGRTDYEPVYDGLIHEYHRVQAHGAVGRGGRGVPREPSIVSGASLSWIDGSMSVNRGEDTALFVGCLSLFDAVAGAAGGGTFIGMAKAAVKILNRIGVSPTILQDERCCGRDLFDIGDREGFKALAAHNTEALRKAKAKKVITICPECAYTLRNTYAEALGGQSFEVRHMVTVIMENIAALGFEPGAEKMALHDPCYLSRYLAAGDDAERLVGLLSTESPAVLERRGARGPCCGAGSFVNHGPHTRTAVNERLTEAHASGTEVLVTACPKCTLLYEEASPACSWKESPVVVRDLITLAASRLRE